MFNYTITKLIHWDFSLFFFFSQDSAQENVITRDIHRTFPAHDYFKDTEGDGQESLYKICKVRQYLIFKCVPCFAMTVVCRANPVLTQVTNQ